MTTKKPNNADKREVYKKQDFNTYIIWRSLPSMMKGQPRHILEKMGIDDDSVLSLLEIKNQAEFAQRFGIKDATTLSEWNKRIDEEDMIPKINAWARKLTPNVTFALYRTARKYGKAAEVKAWYELVEGM